MSDDLGPATACIDCGTRGGYIQAGCHRPWRAHGRCKACYRRWYASDPARAAQMRASARRGYARRHYLATHQPQEGD